MKIEFELNVREEEKIRFIAWMRIFAEQLLLGEDTTILNCKIDGEDFPDLYKLHPNLY